MIGFEERTTIIRENDTDVDILVHSTTESESNHLIQFDLLKTISNATVEQAGGSESSDMTDAIFGRLDDGSITFDAILLNETTELTITTSIVADTRLEGTECFTLRLSAPDAAGQRDVFKCNKDDNDDGYYCSHTLCIKDAVDPIGRLNLLYPVLMCMSIILSHCMQCHAMLAL